MVTKKASTKNINSAMKELEDALLNSKTEKTKRKKATSKRKIEADILILTDIIEPSPYKNMDYRVISIKKNIQNIVKPDIQDWIKNNMTSLVNDSIKKSLNSIKYSKK